MKHEHHKEHIGHSLKKAEHKAHAGFIDNRVVHDEHQEGIGRVLQRHHSKKDSEGHKGSMKAGWKHGKE